MNVSIKLDGELAEIRVTPNTPLHKAQLALVRNYGCRSAQVKMGKNDDMIFILEAAGDGIDAATEEKFNPESVPARA